MSNDRIEIEKLLRTNKPISCELCGGKLAYRSSGTYVCESCGHEELDDFGKINEVYQTFFHSDFPARSCVEVARLPKDVLLEIEAIALK